MIEDTADDGGMVISQILDRVQEPEDLLRVLKKIGFIDEDIAKGTGSDSRTVRRWKTAEPGTVAARHLAEIRNVVSLLLDEEVLTPRGVVFWMRHPNRLLSDYSPLVVIGAGGFRSVVDAAQCFCNSERPFSAKLDSATLARLQEDRKRPRKRKVSPKRTEKLEPVG